MWDTVRLVAHDVLLIGGAICILIVLGLLIVWLRMSYYWMKTGKAIKNILQSLVQIVVNPLVGIAAIKSLLNKEQEAERPEPKKKPTVTKKTPRKKTKTIKK